jgi:hypothetical protein
VAKRCNKENGELPLSSQWRARIRAILGAIFAYIVGPIFVPRINWSLRPGAPLAPTLTASPIITATSVFPVLAPLCGYVTLELLKSPTALNFIALKAKF